MLRLRKHQEEAVKRFKNRDIAMLAFDCGTGKTLTAIRLAAEKDRTTLIIAPKAIIRVWQQELLEDGVSEEDIWVHDQALYRRKKRDYIERFLKWIKS